MPDGGRVTTEVGGEPTILQASNYPTNLDALCDENKFVELQNAFTNDYIVYLTTNFLVRLNWQIKVIRGKNFDPADLNY